MEAHRLAEYFPLLEGDEFNLLVEDIRKNGQLEPIVTVDGLILDGLNRYRACQEIGIEAVTEAYAGDDPLSYVVSLNVRRRHMDTSQRAQLATEMEEEFAEAEKAKKEARRKEDGRYAPSDSGEQNGDRDYQKENEQLAATRAAKAFNVSRASVVRAKRVKEQAPEKVADIVAGRETVGAVDTELRVERAKKRHAERIDKEDTKSVKERPKVVADYMSATVDFRHALKLAIMSDQRQGMFSAPETKQFMKTRHDELRSLMAELESA